jgi:hypothetical protein
MLWFASSGYRFRVPEGEAFTPGPILGPHPYFLQAALDQVEAGVPIPLTPENRMAASTDIRSHDIRTIISGPSGGQSLEVPWLTDLLHRPPVESGGVLVWWNVNPNQVY